MKNKEEQSALNHEKIKAITEKLDISEQKLIDYASMPDIEEQLRDRMEALTQAQERQGTAEERTQRLESQLEEKTGDVMKLTQRLKKNEEHNQRLSQTVDKLLSGKFAFKILSCWLYFYDSAIACLFNFPSPFYSESNERLQSHLKERMHSLEEKNHLSNELERLKKKIEETEQNKARLQSQLEAQNLEIYNLKLFGKQHQPPSNTFNSVDNYRYVISVSPY